MGFDITLGDGDAVPVTVTRDGDGATVWIDDRAHRCALRGATGGYELTVDGRTEPVWLAVDHDVVHVHAFGRAWTLSVTDRAERARGGGGGGADIAGAPMPGTVITVAVAPGDAVTAGQRLVVIESMKMQSEIVAWRDGTVERVHVAVGDTFDRGAPLVALGAEEED